MTPVICQVSGVICKVSHITSNFQNISDRDLKIARFFPLVEIIISHNKIYERILLFIAYTRHRKTKLLQQYLSSKEMCGPTSSSCGGLQCSAKAFCAHWAKKDLTAVLAFFRRHRICDM